MYTSTHDGVAAISELRKHNPRICLFLSRTYNDNLVAYECVTRNQILTMRGFWLTVDAKYRRKNPGLYEPLCKMDRYVYGITTETSSADHVRWHFTRMPHQSFEVRLNEQCQPMCRSITYKTIVRRIHLVVRRWGFRFKVSSCELFTDKGKRSTVAKAVLDGHV